LPHICALSQAILVKKLNFYILTTVSCSLTHQLIEQGRVLDNFYIPARHPNSHPQGAPFEHYGPLQSEVAVRYARKIVEFVRSQMA